MRTALRSSLFIAGSLSWLQLAALILGGLFALTAVESAAAIPVEEWANTPIPEEGVWFGRGNYDNLSWTIEPRKAPIY